MHTPTTATRSGFAEPTAPEAAYLTRIAALEDHLRNETRSSQALLAENANLKALCKVLGVVPELPPDGEPVFLPLAALRLPAAPMVTSPVTMTDPDGTVTEGTSYGRATWTPEQAFAEGVKAGHLAQAARPPVGWADGPPPRVVAHSNGTIGVVFASPDKAWVFEFGHTFAEAVTLHDALTEATAKGRDFFEGVQADEQARYASKGAK